MNFDSSIISAEEAKKATWDIIIIGAGMGGLAAAYQLSKKGKKILIIEKGDANPSANEGVQKEQLGEEERLNNGHWPTQLKGKVNGKEMAFFPPLGCGVGGSTLLYAAALQRLEPIDFSQQALPNGKKIQWPFSYNDLAPYYEQAEKLFHVSGTKDPLSEVNVDLLPPTAMSVVSDHFFQRFKEKGLHPYRLHTGIRYVDGCSECGGAICIKQCKLDAKIVYAEPSVKTGKVLILPRAEVVKLEANKNRVSSVLVKVGSETAELQAKIYLLAAGAYITPTILQRSTNSYWPKGLGNDHDLVGRNLMFHASDFIAFWPKKKLSSEGANKVIALRDYYSYEDEKLGEFQSTGLSASYSNVLYSLRQMFVQSVFRKLSFLRHFLRIPAWLASKMLGEATVFATVVEDFPYLENRVCIEDRFTSSFFFEYKVHSEFKERVLSLRKLIRARLNNLRSLPMNLSVTLNYGHPCGTCKAGDNPETSVVDKNCKLHGVENLYVVDASFMPTSGGTNPSLTVAANAMRVADTLEYK